jgi:acetoin utilization deacetylase AcuC-like enzyme
MELVFSEKCLEYRWPRHIENPERVKEALDFLTPHHKFVEPEPATEEDILAVHTQDHVDTIKNAEPNTCFDADTPAPVNIYEYALLSAGAAIRASNINGFSITRPPGHHAGRNGRALDVHTLGFCYFNNIAVAVKKLDQPTLILDIDGHHGNGTEEIFLLNPKVNVISLHLHPAYPGTGFRSYANCLNYPLPETAGDALYIKTVIQALKLVNMKCIQKIAISAGFDAHKGDIVSLNLSTDCYRQIGRIVGEFNKPVFAVLEGGYIGENVGKDTHALIQGIEETQ